MSKQVIVIANAEAGKANQTVDQLVDILKRHSVEYKLHEIASLTEIDPIFEEVTSANASAIISFGGDGTTVYTAKLAAKHNIPVLPLRGGSANAVASSIGMPVDLEQTIEAYATDSFVLHEFPLATAGNDELLLDLHFGILSTAIANTPRNVKKWLGDKAYGISILKNSTTESKFLYEFDVDGKTIDAEAFACFIANINNVTFLGVKLLPELKPGYLRVLTFNSRNPFVWARWYVVKKLSGRSNRSAMSYWYGKEITIKKAPRDMIFDDRELKATMPVVARAATGHVKMIIPIVKKRGIGMFRGWLLTEYFRRSDHLKRIVTGVPSVRFSQVGPRFYLGGQYGSKAIRAFTERGISGIVSMRQFEPIALHQDAKIEILHLPTKDLTAPDIAKLREGVAFITRHIDTGGAVYVHCRMGEGRGPTMAAAYLISTGFSTDQALLHLRHYRPFARPNKKQVAVLREFENEVRA